MIYDALRLTIIIKKVNLFPLNNEMLFVFFFFFKKTLKQWFSQP